MHAEVHGLLLKHVYYTFYDVKLNIEAKTDRVGPGQPVSSRVICRLREGYPQADHGTQGGADPKLHTFM